MYLVGMNILYYLMLHWIHLNTCKTITFNKLLKEVFTNYVSTNDQRNNS